MLGRRRTRQGFGSCHVHSDVGVLHERDDILAVLHRRPHLDTGLHVKGDSFDVERTVRLVSREVATASAAPLVTPGGRIANSSPPRRAIVSTARSPSPDAVRSGATARLGSGAEVSFTSFEPLKARAGDPDTGSRNVGLDQRLPGTGRTAGPGSAARQLVCSARCSARGEA